MTELPHTRTRMVHWLTTAAALAAVVGASAFVQPPDATANATLSPSAGSAGPAAPDPSRAPYPVDCGPQRQNQDGAAGGNSTGSATGGSGGPDATEGAAPGKGLPGEQARGRNSAPLTVTDSGSGDFDGDGSAETVAVVRCASGIGTPPSGVFVLAPAAEPGERPQVVATLVDPAEQMNVQDLKVRSRTVSATLLGYSSPDVPRCCPDKQRKVKWEWKEGQFVLVPAPVAGPGHSI